MLEKQLVGRCVKCQHPYIPHELKVPVKPSPYLDPVTNIPNPVTHVQLFPSGCFCGRSSVELIPKRKLSWKS